MNNSSRLIFALSNMEVRNYFKDCKHYVSFELPYYFDFSQVIIISSALLIGKQLADVCRRNSDGKSIWPASFGNVNHTILSNKDGSFAWRPMQIIHPILYLDLVSILTDQDNWKLVCKLFANFSNSRVDCISLPRKSMSQDSDKAELIKSWWDKIEQESIRKSLDYRYVFMTDISNCYGSIYTHSLEWVFHKGGRNGVKKDRSNGKPVYNLGTKIDQRLRNMNQGQTIGIPQGSTLMDLIAEMVLGGVDLELDQTIKNELKGFTDFSILRYRDDYRIFTNDFQKGHEVMRILNNALYGWGMKMNTVKTFKSDDLILSSIKTEKVEQIVSAPIRQYYQKEALRIYSLSQKHPNSGLVATELSKFYDRIDKSRHLKHFDHEVIASIITMIAYFSPKYIPQVSAIVSKIIEKSKEPSFGKSLTKRIFKKFEDLPNTGLIDIWLQRIAAPSKIRLELKSELTQVAIAKKDNSMIWNSDWLDGKSKSTIDKVPISNLEALVESGDISPVIERQEFQLFRRDYF